MKQWLCDYHELQTKKKPQFDFVHTTVSARIFEVANECRNYGRMAVVTGESGIGKSTAVNEYESSYPNVYVIRAHHRFSVKATFCDLHRSVGLVGEGSIHCLMEDIVSQLRRTKSIIIVDEAEHLEADCLDMIRQIYDRAGTGVLYVGLERFSHTDSIASGAV